MLEYSHVLIVDDNMTNLQVTTKILKADGYLISLAQDGSAALSLLEDQMPDLILLDIMMPEMDGIEVCKRIKQNEKTKAIPIIFFTAKSQPEDLVEAFSVGGVDYITKPFNKDELLARVKTHTELSRARRKIEEMNRTRDKLYSIIAHDIKTPFTNIIFIIEAIKSNQVDPASALFKELIEKLEEGTKNTFSLLTNLLAWTRFQTDVLELHHSNIDLKQLLLECLQLLRPIAERKMVKVQYEIPDNSMAYGDEVTLHTVFRNILSNAIKFTGGGGSVNISVVDEGDFQKVVICDTGVGMSEDVVDKIFVKNDMYTTNGTNNESGTGLGLLMVKDFIQKNKGEIKADSKIGSGTNIVVRLPVNSN